MYKANQKNKYDLYVCLLCGFITKATGYHNCTIYTSRKYFELVSVHLFDPVLKKIIEDKAR